MMEFVAYIGSDKENWGQIVALLNRLDYEKAILIKSRSAESFPTNERCILIEVDAQKPMLELKHEILERTKQSLSGDFEVALSLASGSGKEHMALLGALLSIPVGVRIVAYTKEGVLYLT
jgi:hypothetical protein